MNGTENFEDTARVLTRSAVSRGLDLPSSLKLNAKLQSLADRQLKQLSDSGIPLACGPRCCHCCYQMIFATAPEIASLYETVLSWPEEKRNALIARLRSFAEEVEPQRAENWARVRNACPFLEDELCAVWEKRPLMCRGLTSNNPLICKDYRENPPAQNFFGPNGETQLIWSMWRGINAELSPNTPANPLEMPLALLSLLEGKVALSQLLNDSSSLSQPSERPWRMRLDPPHPDPLGPPYISPERAEFLERANQEPLENVLPVIREDSTTNVILRINVPLCYR